MKLFELPRYDVNWHSEAHSIPVNLNAKTITSTAVSLGMTLAMGMVHGKLKKKICGQASFFQ